jgi:hypothetical protein
VAALQEPYRSCTKALQELFTEPYRSFTGAVITAALQRLYRSTSQEFCSKAPAQGPGSAQEFRARVPRKARARLSWNFFSVRYSIYIYIYIPYIAPSRGLI